MSVIIRLQNLPWSANALDIRQFFSGLSIPEGGVHIVGGELGDAFIAFSTDEDARQAFNLNGGKIKEVQIKLMLSSRTEMQKVIEAARNPLAAFMHQTPSVQPLQTILPAVIPPLISEMKKDDPKDKGKRDRRRSRSRSRDRKDRSRERDRRDRRRRDRSRSRSRDRRDRRRKDRSISRERRSKDRDRRSKDRRRSEEKSGFSSNSNSDKEPTTKIWEETVSANPNLLLQQQTLLNPFLTNNLEETRRNLNSMTPTPLLLHGNRNGFQTRNDGFSGNRNRENWNSVGPGMHQVDNRHNFMGHIDRSQVNDSFLSGNRQMQNQFGDSQGTSFNRLTSRRNDTRSTRFDSGPTPLMSEHPTLLDLPRSDFNNKNCCVSLRPYFGGYGEIRRFFQGIFIHNTGIKFINDENGKRTGIVHIQFATSEGKMEALQRNGLSLKNNRVEVIHLDDNIFDTTVDRYRPDFKSEHNDRRSPEQYRNRSSPNIMKNNIPSNFSCIAVEDLPLFTKEQDMLKIFSDYSMLSCWLVNQQRHIVAFIKFANPEDAKKAITEKGKYTFDGKPLDIRPCSDEEYASVSQDEIQIIDDDDEEEKDVEIDKVYMRSDCVSLSGLPLKTNDRDISDFFSDVAIVPTHIHLVNSNVGFTGQAFCEFASASDAEIALEKNGLPLGSGTVVVESVLRSEMEDILRGNSGVGLNCNAPRPMYNRGFGGNFGPRGPSTMGPRPVMRRHLPTPVNPSSMGSKGCTLLMENVPYKAGLNEILEFFDGFDIPPDNVLRRYNENGTPSGEAKVIFTSPQDAFQALQERHHKKIRDRPIYLSQC
ncbi:hypothetical protein RI129_009124 [Pyrocoelia pectoralis]|uniref:RRM domain-containing protein n=1 Tax=Pyrocoelia pectoralis TaxID=417401 RepID=A0AAN7V8L2_9COLE